MALTPKPPIALEDRDSVDGRLFSPSAGRNKVVIAEVLTTILPKQATVLEVASGTGEHGIAVIQKRPDIRWQFSDPDEASRESQAAWIKGEGLDLPAPLNIDTMSESWADRLGPFEAIFCANMIHIAPWEAAVGIARNAKKCLTESGVICFYGPFLEGALSVASNLDFDQSLKSRNPAWGVRELESVKHIFAKQGFNQMTRYDMPKNNLFLLISQ